MPKKIDKHEELTPRQRNLLFAQIKEYCENGQTLGSKELCEKYSFDISPATIRNEFIRLRRLGYMNQPYINASSAPTEKAFKLFVSQMIGGLQLSIKQSKELREEIYHLQEKQQNLEKELSRYLSNKTDTAAFAISDSGEYVFGIRHLLSQSESSYNYPVEYNQDQNLDIIDFLENIDMYKKPLLEQSEEKINTLFSSDTSAFPLKSGFALITTKANINGKDAVLGLIANPKAIGSKKTLQVIEAIRKVLNQDDN